MKHARTRSLIDRPDDASLDIAMMAASCAIAFAALIYLLAI